MCQNYKEDFKYVKDVKDQNLCYDYCVIYNLRLFVVFVCCWC